MKVIFLDIDGVIAPGSSKYVLNLEKVKLLEEVLEKTDSKIVISSSWRQSNLEDTIKYLGTTDSVFKPFKLPFIDKIVGITKRLLNRELEIKEYLESHSEIENFVILDDIKIRSSKLITHSVITDTFKGLTNKDIQKIINILNSNNKKQ